MIWEFEDFVKISRFNKEVVVTEKLDGTNAQIVVSDDGSELRVASRTQWISLENDNKGFVRWVEANKEELLRLGPGRHFGEWWGNGIARKYGLKEKRFSLFNTHRWGNDETRPKCCHVVPVLWKGLMCDLDINAILANLAKSGSAAAPGFIQPEGVVIFHTAGGHLYKKTLDNNDDSKWKHVGAK